jgi:hypothetical protein
MRMVSFHETPLPRSTGPLDPLPEAAMRSFPRLGSVNAALVAIYFAPVWGADGLRALISPFHGLEDRVHAVAAGYFRALFDFGLVGLVHTSNVLAGIKFVIATGFLAYLIDFVRAVVVGRDINRETLDVVLVLAAITLMFWAWPALDSGDAALIRLHATQFLLLAGAMSVILVERQIEEAKTPGSAVAPFIRGEAAAV